MPALLFIAALLFLGGISIAYRFSAAAKLKTRIQAALSPLERVDSETRSMQEALANTTESLKSQYVQGIYASRLRQISLDELKKYAIGMRLQALKDIGIRTAGDLQGWNGYRLSQVRGIGPKSATAILNSVATATAAAKSVPIPHPIPPFSEGTERQLMQALYRRRWFIEHVSDQAAGFSASLVSHQRTRDGILAKATFGCWLWKFGANDTIRRALEQGNALIGGLAEQSVFVMTDKLAKSMAECQTICADPVPIELIVQDFNANRHFYEASLTGGFEASSNKGSGISSQTTTETLSAPDVVHVEFGRVIPSPPPKPTGANPPGVNTPATKQQGTELPKPPAETGARPMSDVVHVEFGRVIPGPPPKPTGGVPDGSDSVALKPPDSEHLYAVSVRSQSADADTSFALPTPPCPATISDLQWLKRGEPVQIQGYSLPHGWVYVGKGVADEQHYSLNPWLPAKAGDQPSVGSAGYYTSYSSFSPDSRARYLLWLAGGASSATESSFGMLYFYGIERRLLDLLREKVADGPVGELEQLLQEIGRLGQLFSDQPGSVTQCCLRLSDFAAACALDGTSIPELPKEWNKTWELPFTVRYGIGWFVRDRKPIPLEWALRWAYLEPTIYLRTPAIRCQQEFEAAFASVYRNKFGDGIVLPANKTKLRAKYQPGWPMHFGSEIRHDFSGIPDIAAVTGPQQSLKALVEEATAAIDRYSRYLGRYPAKAGTLEASLNLAPYLWASPTSKRWQDFRTSCVEQVQPMPVESLLRELDPSGETNLSKLPEIAANLSRAFVGIEPDILAGARRPKQSELIVLFPLTSESPAERATPEYERASLVVSLAACVALADGDASEDEAETVDGMIASWDHLHADLRSRLRAQYRLQVGKGISLASLTSHFASLTPDARMRAALSLCTLAAADGNIAAAEVKLLERIYGALELEPKLLYSHLHLRQQPTRELDAQISSERSGKTVFTVDTARLATLRRETEQVTGLLADIFAEEQPPPALRTEPVEPHSPVVNSPDDALLPELDPMHRRFLLDLLRQPFWTRAELQMLAAQSQIMLDGALERINDAALDLLGEPVTEGDDPVYVQQDILEAIK